MAFLRSRCLLLALFLGLAATGFAAPLEILFDGRPGPFVPEAVGQRVRLEVRLVGSLIPLKICSIRVPGDWATVKLDPDGVKGWRVSLRDPSLHLDPKYAMFRLDGAVRTTAGRTKPFPLQGNPELLPIRRADVYTFPPPPASTVWLRGKEIWVGAPAQPSTVDGRCAEVTVRPLVIAIRVRPKKGAPRWLYLNLAPNAAVREGWDDEGSHLRLPPFHGSEDYVRELRRYFRSKGIPFERIGG